MENYNKYKLKLIVNEYEYLLTQTKEVKDIKSKAMHEFHKDLSPYLKKNDGDDMLDEPFDEEKIETTPADPPPKPIVPKKYKTLYRQIVVICHPDKLPNEISTQEKEKYKEIFEYVKEAYEEGKYSILVLYAIKLEIELKDDFMGDIDDINNTIKNLKEGIDQDFNTHAWKYYMEIENNNKKVYIKNFYKKYIKNNK